jgi:hypothetical protein
MALKIWTKPSGYSFGVIQEQTTVFIPLPVQGVVPVPGYSGQNRNTRSTDLNSAFAPFGRMAHPRYTDSVYAMPTGLPNPRTISNLVCYGPAAGNGADASQQAAPGNQSAYAYAWGQFITHEISFASGGTVDASITVPSNDTTYSVPATSTLSSIDGTTLTVGGVITGVFTRGQFLTGTGLIPGTQIVDYGTGDGGAGTYVVSINQIFSTKPISASEYAASLGVASSCTIVGDLLTIGGTITGFFYTGMTITGNGVLPGTQISGYLSGDGGAGTYNVTVFAQTVNQTVGPITITAGDPALAGGTIPFKRTRIKTGTGVNDVLAMPLNETSGWIDGSVIYGIQYPPGTPQPKNVVFANPITLIEGGVQGTSGRLTSVQINGKQYPRLSNDGYNFLLGDKRGQENPDLTSLHTLMLREHNFHAARIKMLHPEWTGRQIFERARAYTTAIMQKITYDEWLPSIVGEGQMPAYRGFDPTVDPTIKVEFTGAALRFGHSIVSDGLVQFDEYGNQVSPPGVLMDMFFMKANMFAQYAGADGYLRKLGADVSNKLDVYMVEDLRSMLFDPSSAHDLAATNIQRGRDLGLPTFNNMRRTLGLAPYTSFSQITSDTVVAANLQAAYGNVELIDLWIGGIAEDVPAGAPAGQMVGPTFKKIIIDEFDNLRAGDQLWYQNIQWNPEDLVWIEKQTLSQVILRNTDTVRMQPNAMYAVERADLYAQSAEHGIDYVTEETATYPVYDNSNVKFSIISGALPSGLTLQGSIIVGSPYIVANQTTYTFCIRATDGVNISDRTFTIDVAGFNPPVFVTPAGLLPIGPNEQLYTIDETYIEYQLEVTDLNLSLGNNLTYSILSGDGRLPPGLTLSKDGLISGFIKATPAISVNDGAGSFDTAKFDGAAYDFGLRPTNGFASYAYDDVIFDYYTPTQVPQSLSLNYQFRVSVTDGLNYAQRIFKIFVAGSDEFRADSTTPDGKADGFTADSSYVRRPVWLTNSNLGVFRSNNYLTVPVALYDEYNVYFRIDQVNHETYAVAYQINSTDNVKSSLTVTIVHVSVPPTVGQYFTLNYHVDNATDALYKIMQVTVLADGRYRLLIDTPLVVTIRNNTAFYIGTKSKLPNGVTFDAETGTIFGLVPYQPVVTEKYTFTLTASRPGDNADELVSSSRTFNIIILGSVNSIINWNSPSLLGTISADYICSLSVNASSNITGSVVNYSLVTLPYESLPPGISLTTDGELVGVVNQFANTTNGNLGLITFDYSSAATPTMFDQGTTTFDRTYTFTIQAADQYGYSAITKTFTVNVVTPNQSTYNNITARPFLIPEQRSAFNLFINNAKIFTPESVYRPNDPNFGIQLGLQMLVYAGVESAEAAAYVGAMGLNVKRKRFQFGDYKTAVAYDPDTGVPVYEVVYVQMVDPLEPNGKHLPSSIRTGSLTPNTITADTSNGLWYAPSVGAGSDIRPDYNITIDSTGYQVSNSNVDEYFPNSISIWQSKFKDVGLSERNYLPLWMRSIQAGQKEQLGYVLSIPLCFCKVGTSQTILLNIKNYSDFDFKTLDYTIDRFTITSLAGYISDKYLVFRNDRITV